MKEHNYVGPIICGHCGNATQMDIVASHSDITNHEDRGLAWEQGYVYETLICTTCSKVTFRRYYYHSMWEPNNWEIETLYPTIWTINEMPDKVKKAFEEANKVKTIGSNAYAVLLGRLLDIVCTDRGSNGRTLDEKLKNLASKGEIPDRLAEMAAQLRKLRNIGAHADLGELTTAEIPILEDLSRAILEYVYKAPALISRAKERLDVLKNK